MADIKISIPKKDEVPAKVQVPVAQPSEKPVEKPVEKQDMLIQVKPAPKVNMNDRALTSMLEAVRNNREATEKVTSMLMATLDIPKFKERLIEEILKDVQLRNKIMLELLKKL